MEQLHIQIHGPGEHGPIGFESAVRNFVAKSEHLAVKTLLTVSQAGPNIMKACMLILCSAFLLGGVLGAAVEKDVTELQIGVKHRPKVCERKAKAGDKVDVHYTVRASHLVDRPSKWPPHRSMFPLSAVTASICADGVYSDRRP